MLLSMKTRIVLRASPVSSEMVRKESQIALEKGLVALTTATVRRRTSSLLETTKWPTTSLNFAKGVRIRRDSTIHVIPLICFPNSPSSCLFQDCDFDSDCLLGLVCYQRGNLDGPDVPGCVGDASSIATGGEDFCIERPTSNWLNIVYDFEDDIGTYPIGRCSADCETGKSFVRCLPFGGRQTISFSFFLLVTTTDEDCEGSLICFSRTNEDDPVPGCIGEGEEAYSYCI